MCTLMQIKIKVYEEIQYWVWLLLQSTGNFLKFGQANGDQIEKLENRCSTLGNNFQSISRNFNPEIKIEKKNLIEHQPKCTLGQ